jgi:hypothetical protein
MKRILIILFVFVSICANSQHHMMFSLTTPITTPNHLVSLWELNETTGTTATDAHGSNDGTYTNSPTLAQSTVTNLGTSVLFNGTNQYVDCGTDTSLDFGTGDFTLACWFKTSGQITTETVLCGNGAAFAGGKGYYFVTNASNGVIYFNIDDNIINFDDDITEVSVYSNSELDDSQWHFVVGVKDGNNLRLYIDGVEQTNSPQDVTGFGSLDSAHPFLIGALYREDTDVVDLEFPGYIDQPQAIGKALTQSEIDYMYDDGNGRAYPNI